jgi:hypothetical protein
MGVFKWEIGAEPARDRTVHAVESAMAGEKSTCVDETAAHDRPGPEPTAQKCLNSKRKREHDRPKKEKRDVVKLPFSDARLTILTLHKYHSWCIDVEKRETPTEA